MKLITLNTRGAGLMDDSGIRFNPETSDMEPVTFDPEICNGCNRCIEVCQVDILVPNPEKGGFPVIAFPGECWYCGCCVAECPLPGAVRLNHLPQNSVHWKRRTTGEDFYL
jgi:NAD-dependent dihydropyrimidine dehydrogenase PreA subunit